MKKVVRLLASAVAAAAAGVMSISASAQTPAWPQRNVQFMLPFGAGSATDIAARLLAERLQTRWGKPVVIEKLDEVVGAFVAGRCDAYTTDKSGLASSRSSQAKPELYEILPENFSKEPLGPLVRQGDEQWLNLVRWSFNAMVEAEEYGITQKNLDDMLKSTNPNVQRILGVTPGMGKNLGVDEKWAYNIIKAVGNYGESFERNIGKNTPLRLERGLNEQWTKGGIMYAWPIR
jgi:general L-amino acid transport system substrate-binding protein